MYDYKTQRMLAVKVIRNKKRFHHQALVEAPPPPSHAHTHAHTILGVTQFLLHAACAAARHPCMQLLVHTLV